MLQVGSYLVFTVSVRQALEQRDSSELLDDPVSGSGVFAPLAGLHYFGTTRHPPDLGVDVKRRFIRCAVDEAVKLPLLLICPKQVPYLLSGHIVFAKQGDPARLEVDTIGKTEMPNVALDCPSSLGGNSALY